MLTCKPFLSITPKMITDWHSGVIETAEEIAGFYFLSEEQAQAELQLLYIDPSYIGCGYGRCLFNSAVETAIRLGHPNLRIEADPNAVGFYRKMGARQTGWCRSDISDGHELPLMILDLSKGAR
ncbi:GNAT family N-acetyltransferase [Sneathiella sp.]|uniref:GNAT family N-acetyltransferase n=1 Tax=Sneathiella sp. TaxID=1964365 RepID=UPI0035634465